MRTTLTIDDDVTAELERLKKTRDQSFKELVNDVLRHGLAQLSARPAKRKPFVTQPLKIGECLVGSIDDISEVLAIAEGEDYR